jgi:hypothetical protein
MMMHGNRSWKNYWTFIRIIIYEKWNNNMMVMQNLIFHFQFDEFNSLMLSM